MALVDPHGRDHAALAAAMRASADLRDALLTPHMGEAAGAASDQPQATDIARCLDGAPLTVDWIGRQVTSSLCGITGSDSTRTGTGTGSSESSSAFTLKVGPDQMFLWNFLYFRFRACSIFL